MNNHILILLSLLLLSCLSSCDKIDEAIDCLDNDGPEFRTEALLPDSIVDLEYDTLILAEVKNEPRDDRFNYLFEAETPLPEGMYLEHKTYSRRAYLRGTPTEPGEYKFTLFVRVFDTEHNYHHQDPYSDSSIEDLCYTLKRKEFTLIVLPTS